MRALDLGAPAGLDPVLEQFISKELTAFLPRGRAVSVNHVRETVRIAYPTCDMPDILLNKHIGDRAIRAGLNVHFDGGESAAVPQTNDHLKN